jgi:membrane protein DedA with SNARE-associated domain
VTDALHFLESLPPGPLYGLIAALAAIENVLPPVPADTAVALGAFLAGRDIMDPWLVFAITWTANVGSGAVVYALARRHGRGVFQGILGRRLLSDATIARIEEQYRRHGPWGIFFSRLLPVWRGLVMPFAGIAGVPTWRALVPLALASGFYYGALIFLIATLGTNLEDVLRLLGRVNAVLAVFAVGLLFAAVLWTLRRLKR